MERVKDKTSDWALASRAHFRGAYLFGLLAFVLFSLKFNSLMLSFFFFFLCKATDSLQTLCFFLEFRKKREKKISNTKELNHGNVGKKKKKRTNASIFKEKKKCNTSQNEDLLCYFQNSGIEQCCLVLFNLLCSVFNVDFMDYLKPVCFMFDYIFSFIEKQTKKRKEKKKDIIAHYLAHTRKSGSCLRKARVPEYQLHAILMYIFMMSKK